MWSLGGGLRVVLAASWGVLGGSWGIVGTRGTTFVVLGSTGPASGAQPAPKRDPTWHPERKKKRTKTDNKNEDEKRRLLKIVLEPSWVDFGSFWVPSWGPGNAPNTTPADVS